MKRSWRPWGVIDDGVLRALYSVFGMEFHEIAPLLQRTEDAVRCRVTLCRIRRQHSGIDARRGMTPAQRERLPVLWADHTLAMIGAQLGCGRKVLKRWAAELGLPPRPRAKPRMRAQIVNLRRLGMTPNEIKRELGCTKNTVIGHLWRAGLIGRQMRSQP